ncbi:MAG: hypothetical protein LBQ86_04720 [Holophagales bacterium]|nr:hypothetical protein [Holophagales bacterium]
MVDFDLFELAGLPFDPPEKAAKKVSAAVDKKKKELNGYLGTVTEQSERDDINAKLSFLETTSAAIFSNDKKLTSAYERLAEAKTKQEIKNLNAIAFVLKQSGIRVITNGTISNHSKKTKLSKEHVREVFVASGFTISEINPLMAFPEFPTHADKIYSDIERLQKTKDQDPKRSGRTLVKDLYDFAAYLVDKPENAAEYRSKPTPELAALLDGFAKEFATRNDPLGKLYASLVTSGKSYVFNSEDNRQKYEAYLKYKTPALTKLFSSMKEISKSHLLDAGFAEECIKQISNVFDDYDVALAIYNKEAGLKDEPYTPDKAVFRVKCHHCQNLVEFADLTEAQKANKCSYCGKPLYKQCNKCRKNVLASLDRCPECGFVFATSAVMFAKHFAAAEQALRKSDFESARDFLFHAQSADPGEKSRTDELAARIMAEEKKYEKPINDLRKLIADKKFERASGLIADMIGKFPGLNVSAYETQINAALSQSRATFANAKKLSPSRQADECLAILRDCVDFKPAINYLQDTPPEICKGFAIIIDGSVWHANISWSRSSEQGISYRLVRKKGEKTPANEKDGEVLIDDVKETSYQDKSILPGQFYSYAVFATRSGVFSSAAGKTIVLLADVTDVHAEQTDATVRLTWNKPKNCTGVAIRRTHNGKETVLTNNAQVSFEDKDVQFGTTYSYRIFANYANMPASDGIEFSFTPALKIDSFTISAERLKENIYRVSWSIDRRGTDLRVLVDENTARGLKSDDGSCDLELPADGFHTIAVLAYSGGNWLRSDNSLQINTYSPCFIDKAASSFHEDSIGGLQEIACRIELRLKIGGFISPEVVGFYYAVRTGASQNRWPTIGEIGKADDIHRIGLATYQKNGEILHTEATREESSYYVSLFTVYNMGGKEIISPPKPCRFDRPLKAHLFWKVSKSFFGGLTLSIEVSGNQSMARIPELALCACGDSQHLLSYSDPKAARLLTVPESTLKPPQRAYQNSYDLKTDKQLKNAKLFLFEVAPVDGENFTLRWATGFEGKV